MFPGCFGSVICYSPATPRCSGCEYSDECGGKAKGHQKMIFGDNRAPIMTRFVAPKFIPEIDKSLPVHTRKRLKELQKDGLTVEAMREELMEERNPLITRGKKPAFLYLAFELHLKGKFEKKKFQQLLQAQGMTQSTARSLSNTAKHIINHLGV